MPLSAIDAINPAFGRLRSMLLRPFRFKTWLKIGFIGWLAGSGASANFNFRVPSIPNGPAPDLGQDFGPSVIYWIHNHWLLIVVIIAFIFALVLVFLYLSCRFRFILFDAVLEHDAQIGRGWKTYGHAAQRYFAFVIVYMLASLAVVSLIVGVPLWRAYKRGVFEHPDVWAILRLLIPVFLLLFLFAIISAIISTLAGDFGVPVLALDDASIGGASRLLRRMIAAEPGAFAGYLGMKLLLTIAVGLVTAFAGIFLFLILLIPALVLVLIGVVIAKALGTVGAIVVAVVGGLLAIAIGFIAAMMLTAPGAVFLTSYSLYFFGGRYSALGSRLWPQPPAPIVPSGFGTPPPAPPVTAPA